MKDVLKKCGAVLIADFLVQKGIDQIFTIPGAKIDKLHDALLDTKIKLVVCRHEQNAAFMAQSYGRITGKPGVVIVTSGPGITNLTTGLLTATTEGDPVLALGGNVSLSMRHKQTHQSADNSLILERTTKFSSEVLSIETLSETLEMGFYKANSYIKGASFISIPQNILNEETHYCFVSKNEGSKLTLAFDETLKKVANLIESSKFPVLLLGDHSSSSNISKAIRKLIGHYAIACVGTFQSAGVISRDLEHLYCGRVGLFKNQPGDKLLEESDLIITIGYSQVEYDPEIWNSNFDNQKDIIHVGYEDVPFTNHYQPKEKIIGEIPRNLEKLTTFLPNSNTVKFQEKVKQYFSESLLTEDQVNKVKTKKGQIHPISFIHMLRKLINDNTIVISDIGSHYMWIAHYLRVYNPRKLLFSNGQQTLGVALPWAIGAYFAGERDIVSISGDGGFLFSATELETAVRENIHLIHFVWTDGHYDMVRQQQLLKYDRQSCVTLGKVDTTKFAESFGAKGFLLNNIEDFSEVFSEAKKCDGPVIIEVSIDYSDNNMLFSKTQENSFH